MPPKRVIDNKPVPFSSKMRYIGVIMDERLTWKTHLETTLKACKSALMYTSNIIRRRWGPKPTLARWLFTGIIRPKLSYASMVWRHIQKSSTLCEKLRRLNRLGAITITPTVKTTPTKGLEVIHDLMPLELFIKQTALASKQRLRKLIKYDWRGTNKSGNHLGH